MSYLGWYDPDRKKPVRQKLDDVIARYEEKFGRTPNVCLASGPDAADLAEPTPRHPGELPVRVEARHYIARWTFYVGVEGQSPDEHVDPDPDEQDAAVPAGSADVRPMRATVSGRSQRTTGDGSQPLLSPLFRAQDDQAAPEVLA